MDGDNYYATCIICKKRLSYKTTNLNLRKHITSNHRSVSLTTSIPDKTGNTKNPISSTSENIASTSTTIISSQFVVPLSSGILVTSVAIIKSSTQQVQHICQKQFGKRNKRNIFAVVL